LLNAIPLTFVLTDYNDTVLRLVTLPNILLTWAANTQYHDFPTPDIDGFAPGDLELSTQVLDRFIAEMKCKDINFVFLSGPWSPSLAALIPQSGLEAGSLILAAETIYSPDSTKAFVDIMITLLRRVKMAKAMIGAKRIYFGVGGSVDGLKEACREQGAVAYEIENHGVPGMSSGVGRALVEVQMY
jgi:protein-histidine N-methyltransferase